MFSKFYCKHRNCDCHIDGPKVSVIVPFFNREKTLSECLESIIHQTLNEIEIILIDDGSTDSSLSTAKTASAKDSRIRIIRYHKNHGLVKARKQGAISSRGEFILYVDSDDLLASPDALQTMYETAVSSDADIVHCGTEIFYPNGKPDESSFDGKSATIKEGSYHSYCVDLYNKEIFLSTWINPKLNFSVWGKLFKRELLLKAFKVHTNHIRVFLNEELLILFPVALEAHHYKGIPQKFYRYRWGGDSTIPLFSLETWEKHCSAARIFPPLYRYISEYFPNTHFFNTEQNMDISLEKFLMTFEIGNLKILLFNWKFRIPEKLQSEAWSILCDYWGIERVNSMKQLLDMEKAAKNVENSTETPFSVV